MRRCGIYCNFSERFYKKFKRNKLYYYRFKEDLIRISSNLIYSGNLVFSIGGTSEFYKDFIEEFFPCFSIIGRVYIEVINDNNYIDYLVNECDYIFVFWHDNNQWDGIMQRFDKVQKEVEIYDMDCVTDDNREIERLLKEAARESRNNG